MRFASRSNFGLLLIALTVIRLAWRASVPALEPTPGPLLLRVGAKAVHVALYLLLFAIPMVGLLMMAAKGRAVEVFGLFTLPPLTAPSRALGHSLEEVHEVMAYLMLSLVGVHAVAALLLRFVFRDSVLARMLRAPAEQADRGF